MDSKSSLALHIRKMVDEWADLPPELVAIISGAFRNHNDVTRFRSICRTWRLLTSPPPPNIISPLFPLTIASSREKSSTTLLASAIYLLRHRSDPSIAWMVSAQEIGVGKLILRHPLTYEKIDGSSGNSLDMLEWNATEIANSCGYNRICGICNQIETTEKVVLLSNFDSGAWNTKLISDAIALYKDQWQFYRCRFTIGMGDTSSRMLLSGTYSNDLEDYVNFNGRRLYAINSVGTVCLVHKNMSLLIIKSRYAGESLSKFQLKRFLVSDGDLYVVMRFRSDFDSPPECHIYKILMKAGGRCWEWERVENLGDKVFFIMRDFSFSVSARLLAHPWKGNCVVIDTNVRGEAIRICSCFPTENEIEVFHLGVGDEEPQFCLLSSLPDYSDLFTPPSTWVNQMHPKGSGMQGINQHMNEDQPMHAEGSGMQGINQHMNELSHE